MRAVVQRVSRGKVSVAGRTVGRIGRGYVVLLGIGRGDSEETAEKLAEKLLNLRVMADGQGKMNLSVKDVEGEILVVPQFTLYADTTRGHRPSFTQAAAPKRAMKLYEFFVRVLCQSGLVVETGEFGAMMAVELVNDGPVTIILDA
jgi:D-tyrosyl-tRNA(Tyr) deacylase